MHRGIRRKRIFLHEEDYLTFLSFLGRELQRYHCTLHAYCLMTNHFHILVETSHDEIWKLMKNLAHNYAAYYNSRNDYTGNVRS
ncbi:MAG: transposase [Eubacterium sp.]|nr:transposase [Eubacterium sp.]